VVYSALSLDVVVSEVVIVLEGDTGGNLRMARASFHLALRSI